MPKLFNMKNINTSEQSLRDEIQALRDLARGYRETRNALIKASWEIDMELTSLTNEEQSIPLLARKAELSKQIEDGKYMEKLDETLKQIREKEIILKDESDVGGPKPYLL